MDYTFSALREIGLLLGSSKIMNIGIIGSLNDDAKTLGQLITLFGDPLYISPNLENAYEYVIMAADNFGNTWFLSAYCGQSGSAIGGNRSIPGIEAAAQALAEYIKQAKPSDFEYEGYYPDGNSKITIKIENGIITRSEVEANILTRSSPCFRRK
jgi:hypothetical protein